MLLRTGNIIGYSGEGSIFEKLQKWINEYQSDNDKEGAEEDDKANENEKEGDDDTDNGGNCNDPNEDDEEGVAIQKTKNGKCRRQRKKKIAALLVQDIYVVVVVVGFQKWRLLPYQRC